MGGLASVCSLAASNGVFGPKMSKNSLNCPLLLTRGDRHFFTDTLCPTPVNCCWRPASQDFLEIRFLFQRNPIFLGREILFPNLTNPFVKCLKHGTHVRRCTARGLLAVSAFLTGGFGLRRGGTTRGRPACPQYAD